MRERAVGLIGLLILFSSCAFANGRGILVSEQGRVPLFRTPTGVYVLIANGGAALLISFAGRQHDEGYLGG